MKQEDLQEQERKEQAAIAGDARLNIELPTAPESEEWLVGALLAALEAGVIGAKWEVFGQRLRADLFAHSGRATCYLLLEELAVSGQTVDCVSFTGMLRNRGELEHLGGASQVMTWFAMATVTDSLIEHHIGVLEEFRARRGMVRAAWAMVAAARDTTEEWKPALERAEGELFNLHEKTSKRGTRHVREVLKPVVDEIDEAWRSGGHIAGGMQLGLTDLDRVTMGLKTGLFVIAARPSRGKTVLACQIAQNVGMGLGHYKEFKQEPLPVLFFSLETTDRALTRRMLLNQWEVPISKARDGVTMSRLERDRLGEAVGRLAKSHIYLHESFGMSIQELRATARMMIARHGIKLILVDYLQLLTSNTKKAQMSRQVEIAEISTGLKHLAHEFDIPVIALAQLNRDGDKARPGMADLRESGQIEQDADYIGMICEAPESITHHEDGTPKDDEFMGFDIAKNKDGPTTTEGGPICFYFDKSIFRLRSWTDSLRSNNPSNYQAGYAKKTQAVKRREKGRGNDEQWKQDFE